MVGPSRGNVITRLLNWLREGYPHGVPQGDYIALFGILHRDLTTEEIEEVCLRLLNENDGEVSLEQIRASIAQTVRETPNEADVRRVASRLAAAGWPLAGPTSDDPVGGVAQSLADLDSDPLAPHTVDQMSRPPRLVDPPASPEPTT